MNQQSFPRYRGFNLLDLFSTSNRWDEHFPMTHGDFVETDLQWMRDWGFNYARAPMSYLYFVDSVDRTAISEARLEQVDRLISLGEKYDIHISLDLHHAPGFCCVGWPFDSPEPGNLWSGNESLDIFKHYWRTFAERYKGIPSSRLSFDLVNEPPLLSDTTTANLGHYTVTMEDYVRVNRETVDAIREIDPDRLIILEGLDGANTPCPDFVSIPNTVQSCRGYLPEFFTHYKCPWYHNPPDETPSWPHQCTDRDTTLWDADHFKKVYQPWFNLIDQGAVIHMGELGCYKHTPHKMMLAWFDDLLGLMTDHHIGYALWNFRGIFGILDTERDDVAYEDWHGHHLDRELLNLLQNY